MHPNHEITSFEGLMGSSSDSEGWPTLDDIEHGRVFIDKYLIKKVEDIFRKSNHCLIRGAEGRGKTVLVRVIAYNKKKENWEIPSIDVRGTREDRVKYIYKQADNAMGEKVLFIVENAHYSLDVITPQLVQLVKKYPYVFFIFTSRREEERFSDPFEVWEEEGCYVDLNPELKEVRHIIETFISSTKINYTLTEQDLSWIATEFGEKSVNLRRLRWYLETWKEKGCSLCSVKRPEVSEKVLKHYRSDLGHDDELQDILYKVAGIFQFDVEFYGGGYDRNVLSKLKKNGIVTFREGTLHGGYYKLEHSTDAFHIIDSLANHMGKSPDEITIDILKEYLQKKPVNYFELLRALFQNKKSLVLSDIFEDPEIYKVIFDIIKSDRILKIGSILRYLTFTRDKNNALKLWFQYKKDLGGDSSEEQKKTLKTKLSEAYLLEIYWLLFILKKLSVVEKDWLENEVLDDNILFSSKATTASFSTISNLTRLLSKKKRSSFISKLDPEVIAEKAKSSNSQQIMWFSIFCRQDSSNANFANSFLSSIYKKQEFIEKLKDSGFLTILHFAKSFPKMISSDFIYILDPEIIAEKAKFCSAQHIMWFLRYCLQDSSNVNFSKSFLLAINRKSKLIEKFKDSNLKIVSAFMGLIRRINLDLYKELNSGLSPYWLQLWLSSSLSFITNKLYRYFWSTGEPKRFAQSIVQNLSINISERIRELYNQSQINQLKVLGKLLNVIYQISFKANEKAIENIAQQIVNSINIKQQDRYTIEQLSLLINNLKKCNESAWIELCNRTLSELNLNDYISITFNKGFALLVYEIYQFNKEKGQELTDKIFSLDFNKLLDNSEIKSISILLWNLLQISDLKTKNWIHGVNNNIWFSKVLSSSTYDDSFHFLWSLYHADKEKGKNVTCSFANNILPNLKEVTVQDLPLLGFFVFCDISFDLKNISIPSPNEIAEKTSEDLNLSNLVFCMCVLKKINDNLPIIFLKELETLLSSRNVEFSIKEIMESHPFENTRKMLLNIYNDLATEGMRYRF